MLKTFYRHAINLRCDSLLKLFLLIVIAVPVAAMPQTRSNMSRDASNGTQQRLHPLKRSTRDTEVRLVGVHKENETKPSPLKPDNSVESLIIMVHPARLERATP